ncbi:ABC-ATPase domain-containing protein [Arhodomonas sp. KWT2]|uniref:ABC-ATPase domain-containing protein n=3 Tax=unclassified Arhodomonas TaxID=2621637 RepID=UPI0035C25C2C
MQKLQAALQRIDGKGYKAYRDIEGEYAFDAFTLVVDHVQADPYAAPSRLRVILPYDVADLPGDCVTGERARAARDYLARCFRRAVRDERAMAIDAGAQTVLDRTAVLFTDTGVEVRFTLGLPARGRTILGRQAAALLCRRLPEAVEALRPGQRDDGALARHCDTVEDQVALRSQLAERGLVAFVADGAVLPRRSGVDDRPLQEAIAFEAPDALAVTLEAPHAGSVRGLAIGSGITLIVGGGFHGKSTLLRALELGVYDHVPGDGRERVVTEPSAVKIRAEDGRAVHALDLSPFINHLPYGKSTEAFDTALASGSTSQAAALQEALELGAGSLLVDEDTSATNFMIRDERMQALVAKRDEPITPFVDRIRELRDRLGVATVLVMGGSGDYFAHADAVIQMHDYLPRDVTAEAHRIAEAHAGQRREEGERDLAAPRPRVLQPRSLDPRTGKGKPRVKVRGVDTLVYGEDEVDLRAVEQLVDPSQVRGVARVLARLAESDEVWLSAPADAVARLLESDWTGLTARPDGDLARPRIAEVMAALNRLRGVRLRAGGG